MGSCDRFCWGCRYYIPHTGGYCNYRYEKHTSRGCPGGKGCARREKTRTKREAQGPDEPYIPRRPPTASEKEIIRLCEEAARRGMSYGMLVWQMEGAELLEITHGKLWWQRRQKLLEAIHGRELTPEVRRHIRELCAQLHQGAAVEEYLLSSNDSAKIIAARHYISSSAIYAGAKVIYQSLSREYRKEGGET